MSCLDVNIVVDVSMLRTAEEGKLRLPPRYPLIQSLFLGYRSPYTERVAQTYAFLAFVCGSSSVRGMSCLDVNIVVDVSMLRTAEEGKLRLPPRYPLSVAERLARRQAQSVPLLAELRQKLLRWKEQLLPKHPMAEAVNYTLGQWSELNVFCSDGAVPIDNNISEREMKRVVLNRKNSLFVGNPRGGRTAAILASLTSTCRRHDLDPQLYLTQLLMNLPTWPQRDLDAWLPDQWKLRCAARLANLNQPRHTTPENPSSPVPA